jgi:PilZ domain
VIAGILGVLIVSIETSPSSQSCRRGSAREPVALGASALAIARSRSVIISDLSREGARIDGRDLPPPGDDLLMVVGSLETMATVVWRSGDKCGIIFDQSLPYKNIVQMKREADWTSIAGWMH